MIRATYPHRCRVLLRLGGTAAAGLLLGCTLPYRPVQEAPLVAVTLVDTVSPQICIDRQWYHLEVKEQGPTRSVLVPSGKRITLMVSDVLSPAAATPSCKPMLSVIPAAGTRLALHSGLVGAACFIEIVREDQRNPTGVAPEPSIGPPQC